MDKNALKSSISDEEDCKPSTSSEMNDQLFSVTLPTHTKRSRKRKLIKTDFDETQLSTIALEAQRNERERLERLIKLRDNNLENQNLGNKIEIPFESVDTCTNMECQSSEIGSGADEITLISNDTNENPITSDKKVDRIDVIELSSDDDSGVEWDSDRVVRPLPASAFRSFHREYENSTAIGQLHRLEKEKVHNRRNSDDLENTELFDGELLINAGKPADDPDVCVPSHLKTILQPHQLGGIRFMYDNVIETVNGFSKSGGFGCILAHSMGLGKTLQAITFIDIFLRVTNSKKVLIIVPVNTIQNWYNEFEKWLPNKIGEDGSHIRQFKLWLVNDTLKTEQRIDLIEMWHKIGGVLLIGYDMLRLLVQVKSAKKFSKNVDSSSNNCLKDFRSALLDPGADLVICDEGHRIKNFKTGIAVTLSLIKTRRRIVLTGYPLQNNLMEYYCMVDFVRPFYLGTKKEFAIMFEKPITNGLCIDATQNDVRIARQRTHVLVEMLKGFVQRRTHHLLKKILPPSFQFIILLRKSLIQRLLYRSFLQYALSTITTFRLSVFNPLKAFAVCSKIWAHPDILYVVLRRQKEAYIQSREKTGVADNSQCKEWTESLSENYTYTEWLHDSSLDNANKMNEIKSSEKIKSNSNSRTERNFRDSSRSHSPIQNCENMLDNNFSKHKETYVDRLLLGEFDLDNKVNYDWAYSIMDNYVMGNIENGYKIVLSLAIIQQAVLMGEKILLFSQSLLSLNLIEQYIKKDSTLTALNGGQPWKRFINYFRFDGSTSATERERLINLFNENSNVNLFLISTKAGSLGINLVSANRVIIYDVSWNPCHDAQAICRIYRYGQTRRTYIYRLIIDNSMERAIFNRQLGKFGLLKRVVDDRQTDIDVTKEELDQLLVYNEALDINNTEFDVNSWHIEDELLKVVASKYSKFFSQMPILHESLLFEREEGLSMEEKIEAQLLYEKEKCLYDRVDHNLDLLRSSGSQVFTSSSQGNFVDRTYSSTAHLPDFGPYSLMQPTPTPTPLEMVLQKILPFNPERTDFIRRRKEKRIEVKNAANMLAGGKVTQITVDRELTLPSITESGKMHKLMPDERLFLVTLPTGVFLRSLNGEIYDARNSIYDPNRKSNNRKTTGKGDIFILNKSASKEIIDLCDSD